MTNTSIYQDMAQRTGGDIYLGLVGPVRTGKSTFIRRFMETLVIPNIEDVYARERAKDELPQSGSGRTIMTAEPKFVPEDAVNVTLDGGVSFSVRLVDCVGYMVDGASGQFEDGAERMVATPWFDEEVSMSRAAEEGTRRVIAEHSTIGVVMTTDGSICGIPREGYVPAEERVVAELEVNTPSVSTPVRRLSGGNVQKVLVGREIASAPTVLLTAYAVRGLDINSSYTIYDLINKQKERGVAVVYVGEDLDVLLELCDRILVLCGGRVSGLIDGRGATKRKVGLMMTKLGGAQEDE